jgi:hypothetical protein
MRPYKRGSSSGTGQTSFRRQLLQRSPSHNALNCFQHRVDQLRRFGPDAHLEVPLPIRFRAESRASEIRAPEIHRRLSITTALE